MKNLQPLEELERWWEKPDPWDYEKNPEDINRRAMLLASLPKKKYARILDIGCGNGFVTNRLPGEEIIGIDISANAIKHANKNKPSHIQYFQSSLFQLSEISYLKDSQYDLIVITGVLYPQYIGESNRLVYLIIDNFLRVYGDLVCCHIEDWYTSRFPYVTISRDFYPYREYIHLLEVYRKL
jgi:predicted TPR repeat methyltransferase